MAKIDTSPLAPGLYFVAVPIGNARDITLRALDVMSQAEVLVAEDTRSLRRLMEIHGVALNGRRVLAYHDHNGAQMRPKILEHLNAGKSVLYASEAGTPLVADPGYALGRAAIEADCPVIAVPGASAALAALNVSGLPSDAFLFAGFAPTTNAARRKFLEGYASLEATVILYESPKRLHALLSAAVQTMGPEREAAVCRELTKKFEEVRRGKLVELAESYANETPKGEVVVCISKGEVVVDPAEVEAALREALKTQKLKAAANDVADRFGLAKRDVYQLGLSLRD